MTATMRDKIAFYILITLSVLNLVAFIVDIAQGLSIWYLLMNAFSCVFTGVVAAIFYLDIRRGK